MEKVKIFLKFLSWTLVGLIVMGIIIFTYTNRQTLLKTIFTQVSPKPETITELYFENHTQLLNQIQETYASRAKIITYTFSFTIHNLENKDMNYPYEVYEIVNGEKIIIESNEVYIKKNSSLTIDETFSKPRVFPRTQVVVNLTQKKQQIFFWIGEQK